MLELLYWIALDCTCGCYLKGFVAALYETELVGQKKCKQHDILSDLSSKTYLFQWFEQLLCHLTVQLQHN